MAVGYLLEFGPESLGNQAGSAVRSAAGEEATGDGDCHTENDPADEHDGCVRDALPLREYQVADLQEPDECEPDEAAQRNQEQQPLQEPGCAPPARAAVRPEVGACDSLVQLVAERLLAAADRSTD